MNVVFTNSRHCKERVFTSSFPLPGEGESFTDSTHSAHPRPGKHLPPFVGTTLTHCTYLDYQFQKSTSHFTGISNSFYQNNTPIYRRLLVDDIPAISFGPLIAPLTAC